MKRRTFLKTLGASAAVVSASPLLSQASDYRLIKQQALTGRRVVILGGGVGGMTAAHELAERGFDVAVYELKEIPGGKARSIPARGTGRDGRLDLPGEHGFRFFPGFYSHLDDTMSRIPFGNGLTTYNNLVAPPYMQFGRTGGQNEIRVPMHLPRSITDMRGALGAVFNADLGIPSDDLRFFADKLITLLTSCEERRYAEYENIAWWDFIEADQRSENFRRFLATGLMRCLVACQPHTVSARTGGYTFLQLFFSLIGFNKSVDRVLNGTTNEQWIFPWLAHLKTLGVKYHLNSQVKELHYNAAQKRVCGATVSIEGRTVDIEADHIFLAVPVEVALDLIPDNMKSADPALSRLANLKTEWMNGIQFFLTEDVLPELGHTIYFDSPWAVTSISQRQYWANQDLSRYGNGNVRGILSVDVSDWNTPGILYGKTAKQCTREEVIAETWAQMKLHLNENGRNILRDDMIIDVHVDPGISFVRPGITTNSEPLLVNTAGSWTDRPEAHTSIENFYIASDYVRTYMDLASMESACEAARRGVNKLLERTASNAPRCLVDRLQEPALFRPFIEYDRRRFLRGLPYDSAVLAQL